MILQYRSQSAGGNPTVLSLPVEWEAQLTSQNGTQTMAVQGPDPQGVYSTTIPFYNPGSLNWVAEAVVREPGGTRRQLLRDTRSFNVAPVKSVSSVVQLVEPASKPLWWRILEELHLIPSKPLHQIGRSPLGHPVPIDVEVVLMDGGQTAIDPATVFRNITDPSGVPLTLTVTDGGGKNEKTVPLARTVTPGHFRARIDRLSLGPDEFVVQPVHGLVSQCGYRLPAAMQATIVLVENPFVLLEFGIASLLMALVLYIVIRYICLRRNPCKGYITVQGSDKRPVHGWYRDLRKRNRWRIKNVPPITGIKEMEVRSTKGRCGQQPLPDNRVDVKVWPIPVSDQDKADPIHRTMSPNDPWQPPNLPGGFVIKYVLDVKNLKN